MRALQELIPSPPAWALDWAGLSDRFAWIARLSNCPQDGRFHAEGDVGTHTRMACQELISSPRFRALSGWDRAAAFLAVLLHDVAKPDCTRPGPDGRLTSRGHSAKGESLARRILWTLGVPFALREAICALIRFHQAPFFVIDDADPARKLIAISQSARCDLLALVAEADGKGRRCADPADQRRILENVELFRELSVEWRCQSAPYSFASDHSRFLFFQKQDRVPSYQAFDDTTCQVILMSGLPGSGKDHWIRSNASDRAIISLDDMRGQLGIAPEESQGRVVAVAKERAKELLRRHQSFAWNATNLSRQLRRQLVSMMANYRARIRIVYLEAPPDVIRARNHSRPSPVPDRVIDRLLNRWTVPDATEAHDLDFAVSDGAGTPFAQPERPARTTSSLGGARAAKRPRE